MIEKFYKRAEELLEQAAKAGEFQNLPGSGKPLPEDLIAQAPEEERMSLRILKNAGILPPELEKKKQINLMRKELEDNSNLKKEDADALKKKITLAEIEYNIRMESMRRRS